jgi:hypothetical protein
MISPFLRLLAQAKLPSPLPQGELMAQRLTKRELTTILAALRYWQQDLAANEEEGPISSEHFDGAISPLSVEEIDGLCERLNFESAAIKTQESS